MDQEEKGEEWKWKGYAPMRSGLEKNGGDTDEDGTDLEWSGTEIKTMNTEKLEKEMSPTERTEMDVIGAIARLREAIKDGLSAAWKAAQHDQDTINNLNRKNKEVMLLCHKRDMQYLEFQSTLTHIRQVISVKRAEYHRDSIMLQVLKDIEDTLDRPKQNQVNQITQDNPGIYEEYCAEWCAAQQPKKSEKTLSEEINELKAKIEGYRRSDRGTSLPSVQGSHRIRECADKALARAKEVVE